MEAGLGEVRTKEDVYRAGFLTVEILFFVLFVVMIVVVISSLALTRQQTKQVASRCPEPVVTSPDAYVNERLGYALLLPRGYRIAGDLSEFLSAATEQPISNWSTTNSYQVVITSASEEQEQEFVRAATYGTAKIDLTNVTALPGSIYLVASNLNQNTEQTDLTVQYSAVTVSGLRGLSYTDLSNESVVIVPYVGSAKLPEGDAVESIFIKMKNGSGTPDVGAFNSIIDSFCYIKT